MNPQPIPDSTKAKRVAELASNAMLNALLLYARKNDAALVEAIRLSEVGR